MELFFCGLAGTYEAEHIARMFFPGAKLVQRRCAPGAPCVRVRRAGARVLCGVRTAQRCGVKAFRLPDGAGPKEEEYEVCRALYMLLRAETGVRPPWGMLTGVRPVRLLHDMRRRGLSPAQQQAFFCRRNDVSAEKYKLAVEIANNQQDVIKRSTLRSYSLYISIPFCPSRCSYCSFVSTTTEKSGALVAPYLQRLEQELQSIAAMAEKLRLRLETGRTHQIRVHLQSLGCPIAGDYLYGEPLPQLAGRFALHAARMQLTHPMTGETLTFESPLPEALAALLKE